MSNTVATIPVINLLLGFVPAAAVVGVMWRWSVGGGTALYAVARMLVQLIAVGYVLAFIFAAEHALPVLGVLAVMLLAAGWIAIRPLQRRSGFRFRNALAATAAGGIVSLLVATEGVLAVPRWFEPHVLVPLAGMAFSNAMNAVSLAAERFESDCERGLVGVQARNAAMNAAMIPVVNSLFAVGLVSLPGMMTGQILSGVDPLLAVRYQIMVMAMIFAASGIASACYLVLARREGQ